MWVAFAHFFSKNISVNAIFNVQSFNDTLTNDIVSFEQLGPGFDISCKLSPIALGQYTNPQANTTALGPVTGQIW